MGDRIRTTKGVLVNGQFHELPRTPQGANYQHVGSGLGRSGGKAKNTATVAVAHGMRNVNASGHPLLSGARRPLDAEPLQKIWQDGKTVPTHEGMHNLGGLPNGNPRNPHCDDEAGSKHLTIAANLGRGGHNHVGHLTFGTLPTSTRKLSR